METTSIINFKNNLQKLTKDFSVDGALINIPDHLILEQPIILLYTTNHATTKNHIAPQNHIVIGKHSNVQIIEIYLNKQPTKFITNAKTTIHLQENANLSYTVLQQANVADQQNLTVRIIQQAYSQINSQIFSYGGKKNQTIVQAILAEHNATCNIQALEYSKRAEKHSLNLQIEHLYSRSVSDIIVRSLADDNSNCFLDGKILVAPNAAKIKANMQHKTMLLSAQAKINTKPQLEIYNDDVICCHGATIGSLDLNAMLYMNTRGISVENAKQLLLQSFIAPIIESVQCMNMRQQIKQLFCPGSVI